MFPLEVMALRVGDRLPVIEPFVPETTRLRSCGIGDAEGLTPVADPAEADAVSASAKDSEVEKDSRQRLTVDFRPKMGFVSLASAKWKGPNNCPKSSKKLP